MIYQQLIRNHDSAITRVKAKSNCGSPASPQLLKCAFGVPIPCRAYDRREAGMNRIESEMPSSDGEIRD
jgi:hypothetical protein